jgi:hypothetical protein
VSLPSCGQGADAVIVKDIRSQHNLEESQTNGFWMHGFEDNQSTKLVVSKCYKAYTI